MVCNTVLWISVKYAFITGHHTICSIGTGCSLIEISCTQPLRIVMTLSAIGVIAWLWVMTITFLLKFLQSILQELQNGDSRMKIQRARRLVAK